MNYTSEAHKALSDRMEFDHVIRVDDDGTVTDGPDNVHAPSVYMDAGTLDAEPDGEGWYLLSGYTGQYGYNGPVMHSSEFIGGGLADDILSEPGIYAAVVVYAMDDDDDETDNIAGWAIARYDGEA